ncbi:hypothetical protein Q31a_00060 [Aureliella helgolandensis]|uniref:Uncharacterized protein n=1 Tax=Aureliella helgolandensis TaxID=2527968 RepID=A0A518FZE2_9BACT|nr:hypothetical protein Q31a_00060 [Aureliella helgolandensis]
MVDPDTMKAWEAFPAEAMVRPSIRRISSSRVEHEHVLVASISS